MLINKHIIIIISIITLFLIVGCSQKESEIQEGFTTYSNEDWGISLFYPSDWSIDEFEHEVEISLLITPTEVGMQGNHEEILDIKIINMDNDEVDFSTLEEFYNFMEEIALNQFESNPNQIMMYELIEKKDIEFKGNKGLHSTFKIQMKDQDVEKLNKILYLKDKKAILIRYKNSLEKPEIQDSFDTIIKSVEIN